MYGRVQVAVKKAVSGNSLTLTVGYTGTNVETLNQGGLSIFKTYCSAITAKTNTYDATRTPKVTYNIALNDLDPEE